MAKYGRDYYGIGFYGPFTVTDYSAYPFTAIGISYGQISLNWVFPTGDWSQIKVLRNSYGFPVSAVDGVVIVDEFYDQAPTEHLDAGDIVNGEVKFLTQGRFYYYSIFVRETVNQSWVRAANAIGISVKNYQTANDLYKYLPDSFKVNSLVGDIFSESGNQTLRNFLSIFAFDYDLTKTYTENIYNLYKTDTLPGQLVPQMIEQFGGCFEPEVGLKQQRVLLRNLFSIYKQKGSFSGLESFVKAFTGYDASITKGKNLFLDYNDSSFEEGIGNWQVTGATIVKYDGSPLVIEPYEITNPTGYPSRNDGMLRVTSTGTSTIILTCGADNPITKGIPVTEGETYTFSAFSAANTTTRNIRLGIQFYNRFGVALGTLQQGVPVSNATLTWDSPTLRPFATAIAPTDAHYASVNMQISSPTNTEIHYFDSLQFEEAISKTSFEEARRVNIELIASRINELPNPTFTTSASPWSATNAALSLTSSIPGVDIKEFPVTNKQLTGGYATLTVSSSYLPLFPGQNIVVSGVGSPFDGSFPIFSSNPVGKTVTYAVAAAPVASTAVSPTGLVSLSGDSLVVTPSGVSLVTVQSHTTTGNYISVLPDYDYTFSAYIQPLSTSENVTPAISWYTSSNTLIQTDAGLITECATPYTVSYAVLSGNVATLTLNEPYEYFGFAGNDESYIVVDNLGSPYDGTWKISSVLNNTISYARVNANIAGASVNGFVYPKNVWTRVSVSANSPTNAAKASVKLNWTPSSPGAIVYIEDALFEKASFLLDYFDGEKSGSEDTTSLLWEGTADDSRSHYYKNKFVVEDRLKRELEKYLLLGTTYALYFAQP